jgi:hypothetical protein
MKKRQLSSKRNTWQVRDVDEETKRRIRIFAAKHNIKKTSLAIAKMAELALKK